MTKEKNIRKALRRRKRRQRGHQVCQGVRQGYQNDPRFKLFPVVQVLDKRFLRQCRGSLSLPVNHLTQTQFN